MIDKYFKDLKPEEKELAIKKMAVRTNSSIEKVTEVFERRNPLMEIHGDELLLLRHTYRSLLEEFFD